MKYGQKNSKEVQHPNGSKWYHQLKLKPEEVPDYTSICGFETTKGRSTNTDPYGLI
jgi:hypothetical protein